MLILQSLTTRLSPSAFPQLPETVKLALIKAGFTIPQSFADSIPHNVISGEFCKRGQIDWAVLASQNRVSCILIFWGGSDQDTTHLRQFPDENFLQETGDQTIGFSRAIRTITLNIPNDCIDIEDQSMPRSTDHDAIEEGFLNKATDAYYFSNGKWFSCPTGD
jgi:hypothetical protein